MTYFGFHLRFMLPPILLLAGLAALDARRGVRLQPGLRGWHQWPPLLAMVLVALVYTTPWDNYLVATRVWWYDPALVTGLTIGWVPIEEYTFFILQPLLTGLWMLWLMRHLALPASEPAHPLRLRRLALALAALLWLGAVALLLSGWLPGTYLGLELVWGLLPLLLQLGFGADILWRARWHLLWGIGLPTLYLVITDGLAIGFGTWTINPARSLQCYLGGVLPVEELIFFLLTNVLMGMGMLLLLSDQSWERFRAWRARRRGV